MSEQNQKDVKAITPLSFMGSLISAWFGVSTEEKRERDFENGKFSHFIIGGIIWLIRRRRPQQVEKPEFSLPVKRRGAR